MGGLSAAAREVALAAAALSRPTVATVAAALAPPFDAASGLAEAEEAEVIVSARGRIRFTHPLLASVVYGSVSDERRRRLHSRLAEVVSEPEERALHRAQSTLDPDPQTADEIELAARRAAHRGAHDAAAELFETARRLTPADRPDDLARRYLGGAAELNVVGEFADAHELATRTLAFARTPALRVAALELLSGLAWSGGDAADARRLVDRAVTEAAGDRMLLGPVYARAVRVTFALDFSRALEEAEAASELLNEASEPALLGHVLVDRFWAGALCGLGANLELLERGLRLEAQALPDPPRGLQTIPLLWLHCTDDFAAARARYALEERWSRERGFELYQVDRRSHLALAELRRGTGTRLSGLSKRAPSSSSSSRRAGRWRWCSRSGPSSTRTEAGSSAPAPRCCR